jgi:hypothetical protein
MKIAAPGEFLSFREKIVPESIKLTEVNGVEGTNTIGEGPSFDSNWYAPGTDLFDDEPDQVLAIKTAAYKVFAQLGNGDLIGEINETIRFVDGPLAGDQIFTAGFLKAGLAPSGGTTTLRIIGGTGSFKDIRGVENITSVGPMQPGDISLVLLKEIKGTRRADVINGGNASELITGNDGNDIINGGQGNDIIEGGRGGDIIRGGAGDDILAADQIDRFDDFGGLKSELRGGDGNDTIFGGSKDDFISGGNGNDPLRGQDGIDVADYSDLTFDGVFDSVAGLDVNLNTGKAQHSSDNNPLRWTDSLTGIENVIGTSRNDRFIGDENNNVFYGLGEVGRNDRQTEFISLQGESYKVTGDVVEYNGNFSEFTFGTSKETFIGLTVTGPGAGTDILIGIEFLKFNDRLVATDSIVLET